jgi:hypothetical protein
MSQTLLTNKEQKINTDYAPVTTFKPTQLRIYWKKYVYFNKKEPFTNLRTAATFI